MADVEFLKFKKLLRQNGHFITTPRMRLFGYLQKHPTLTLKELIALTKKHDQVTVYRTVELFERLGIINKLRLGGQTKLELSDVFRHHHHHMTCVRCGKVLILKDNSRVETEIRRISQLARFKPVDHQLEIRGLCANCQNLLAKHKP